MLGFNEWLTEAVAFGSANDSLIGKNLVRVLGGDPEVAIDLTSLLTRNVDGREEALTADELYVAIDKALDMAKAQGAKKEAINRNRLGLIKIKGQDLNLLTFATNLVNAALVDIERQDRERGREDWERTKRKINNRRFGRPDDIDDDAVAS